MEHIDVKKLPATLRPFVDKIEEISDERPDSGYWVYLMPGWTFDGCVHIVHEDTIGECVEALKTRVWPCTCAECEAAK